MVANATTKPQKGSKRSKRGPVSILANARQLRFAQLVVAGKGIGEAYRLAYEPKTTNEDTIAQMASRRIRTTAVLVEIRRLREKEERMVLLTVNDRLKNLAAIILDPTSKKMEVIAASVAYTKISGDEPPQREVRSAPEGSGDVIDLPALPAPAQTTVRALSPTERLAEIKAARARAKEPRLSPAIPAFEEIEANPS